MLEKKKEDFHNGNELKRKSRRKLSSQEMTRDDV